MGLGGPPRASLKKLRGRVYEVSEKSPALSHGPALVWGRRTFGMFGAGCETGAGAFPVWRDGETTSCALRDLRGKLDLPLGTAYLEAACRRSASLVDTTSNSFSAKSIE